MLLLMRNPTHNLYYKFTQISRAIPKKWKQRLRENSGGLCYIPRSSLN